MRKCKCGSNMYNVESHYCMFEDTTMNCYECESCKNWETKTVCNITYKELS